MTSDDKKILIVVMDGVGHNEDPFGNAVAKAVTPVMDYLKANALFTTLRAHGTAVGLASDADMGNSEVGHNAIGAGRVFNQGAKLVDEAITSLRLYKDPPWQKLIQYLKQTDGSLHFIGLLSDGNVHSHERHLFSMLKQAKLSAVRRSYVHALFDGRDVPNGSAEKYIANLNQVCSDLNDSTYTAAIASAGGRMHITMDRYEADWSMVERGWRAHVLGDALPFHNSEIALKTLREKGHKDDQFIPAFVITKDNKAIGPIVDGDAVVMFNFRGDRAIEISQAFTEANFTKFERVRFPKVFYAGMMEYDGDKKMPPNYLVNPLHINHTLSEVLVAQKLRQFACSETQKYGHVTYFWNGNRTGYLDKSLEKYVEIPSDSIVFNVKPWMKAAEITAETLAQIETKSFDVGRINFANGDMVGHTGDFDATVVAVQSVDLMLGRLLLACEKAGMMLLVTADHGNADQMFEKGKVSDYPNWAAWPAELRPQAKTSHTLNRVPFYFYDPKRRFRLSQFADEQASLANIAGTVLTAMGMTPDREFFPSLISNK